MNFQLKMMFQLVHVPGGPGRHMRLPSETGIIPSNQSLTDCASRDINIQVIQKTISILTVVILLTMY